MAMEMLEVNVEITYIVASITLSYLDIKSIDPCVSGKLRDC